MDFDYERLREDLIEYYGTASVYFPVSLVDVSHIETASDKQLKDMAIEVGLNLNDYVLNTKIKKL